MISASIFIRGKLVARVGADSQKEVSILVGQCMSWLKKHYKAEFNEVDVRYREDNQESLK